MIIQFRLIIHGISILYCTVLYKFIKNSQVSFITYSLKQCHEWMRMQEVVKYGEIFLALNYLPKAGRLSVDVLKCKELAKKDSSHKVGMLGAVQILLGTDFTGKQETRAHE